MVVALFGGCPTRSRPGAAGRFAAGEIVGSGADATIIVGWANPWSTTGALWGPTTVVPTAGAAGPVAFGATPIVAADVTAVLLKVSEPLGATLPEAGRRAPSGPTDNVGTASSP